jgi:threonine 3-dehydrogenase
MRALVKNRPSSGLEFVELPVPILKPGEVLIKVKKAGICGTDLHIYDWDEWAARRVKPGLIIGHEFMGEVAALSDRVSNVTVGDRVSGEGHIGCGQCY